MRAADCRIGCTLRDRVRTEVSRDIATRRTIDRVNRALDVDVDDKVAADHRQAVRCLRVAHVAVAVFIDVHAPELHVRRLEAERRQQRRQRGPKGGVGCNRVVRLHLTDLGHLAHDVHGQAIGGPLEYVGLRELG
jgi:hypothetical protein